MQIEDLIMDITQHIEVKADIGEVWKGMLDQLGEGHRQPNGESMNLMLEPWPGGRWYRDRGNGVGHLWGHVQTIKAPTLIELTGPMFMSSPVLNFVEVKLEAAKVGVSVTLRHKAVGLIKPEFRNVEQGWGGILKTMKEKCEAVAA